MIAEAIKFMGIFAVAFAAVIFLSVAGSVIRVEIEPESELE